MAAHEAPRVTLVLLDAGGKKVNIIYPPQTAESLQQEIDALQKQSHEHSLAAIRPSRACPFCIAAKCATIYAVGNDKLLVVQTDRLSAFDVILADPIPGKGEVLTTVSNFWFDKLKHVIPNHLTGIAPESVVKTEAEREAGARPRVRCEKIKALPIEAIVRGYLVGSGWKEYQKTGAVCGIKLPAGLREAEKLHEPLFTPSTKAAMESTTRTFRCAGGRTAR